MLIDEMALPATPSTIAINRVNLILFESAAEAQSIPSKDHRARHIRKVLRMSVGGCVYVGVVNGMRGLGRITQDDDDGLMLDIAWEKKPPVTHPIWLLVGLPRPHTAKRVLFDAACLGVAGLTFFQTEKGEPSYARSSLWSTDEWRERLWLGAEQGFATQLPEVRHFSSLGAVLEASSEHRSQQFALDVYEGVAPLSRLNPDVAAPTALAIGPERGWSSHEREQLRAAGFQLAGLGERVLRTEAACLAGVSVILASWGRM